jgi:hypothetical protein
MYCTEENFLTRGENVTNPLNAELIHICHLLVLLLAHPIFHVSRIRGKLSIMESVNVMYKKAPKCISLYICLNNIIILPLNGI